MFKHIPTALCFVFAGLAWYMGYQWFDEAGRRELLSQILRQERQQHQAAYDDNDRLSRELWELQKQQGK